MTDFDSRMESAVPKSKANTLQTRVPDDLAARLDNVVAVAREHGLPVSRSSIVREALEAYLTAVETELKSG